MKQILPKEALYQYYIVENHSRAATAIYFSTTEGILKSSLSAYGFRKDLKQTNLNLDYYSKIKDNLLKFYITENNTISATCIKFNLSKNIFIKLLNFWDIHKDRHKSALNSRKAYTENFYKQMPSRDEIYQYYIVENHSRADCLTHWNTTKKIFSKWLNLLSIKKVKDLPLISKEDFYKYYIIENHTQQECTEYFRITLAQVITFGHKYNIYKTPNLYGSHATKNNKIRWSSYSDEERRQISNKISKTLTGKSEEEKQKIQASINLTKYKNKSFSSSKSEDLFYQQLCSLFSVEDIFRQYKEARYPFCCDFYIKSLDLFIELNFFASHGTEPFNPQNQQHLQKLELMRQKLSSGKKMYEDIINVWTRRDPLKVKTAKENNLNYFALYNKKQSQDLLDYLKGKIE